MTLGSLAMTLKNFGNIYNKILKYELSKNLQSNNTKS
jgi:hypothetical protein